MTANSFASVSLDPPLVLWSVAKATPSFAAFVAADAYAVHFLAADQRDLAMRFASRIDDKFAGLDHRRASPARRCWRASSRCWNAGSGRAMTAATMSSLSARSSRSARGRTSRCSSTQEFCAPSTRSIWRDAEDLSCWRLRKHEHHRASRQRHHDEKRRPDPMSRQTDPTSSHRDFAGYRGRPPNPNWPGGAKVAVSFVVNFEEGAEFTVSGAMAATRASTRSTTGWMIPTLASRAISNTARGPAGGG
jgi:hypothetical protein